MTWCDFVAAAQQLHGDDWRAALAADLEALFCIDAGAIARWDACLEVIPLHVELALRSRLFAVTEKGPPM